MSGNIKFSPEQGREMASEIIRRRIQLKVN